MKRCVLAAILVFCAAPASAQLSRDDCAVMSLVAGMVAGTAADLSNQAQVLDIAELTSKADDPKLRATLERMSRARDQLLPSLRDFAGSSGDVAQLLRACS